MEWKLHKKFLPPQDFLASAVAAGIKKEDGKLDVGILYSTRPSIAAVRFTTNVVKAAPLLICQKHLQESQGAIRAIFVNSGNANACNGESGLIVAQEMAQLAGEILSIPPNQVLVLSTGVIGVPLPLDRIRRRAQELKKNLGSSEFDSVSSAIMTTDTVPKICTGQSSLNGIQVRISGMTKGAGMIHPRMATTLVFVLTDAAINRDLLEEAVTKACEKSYNRITVDGDTSTNDTLAVVCNGASDIPVISEKNMTYRWFLDGLTRVCQDLAKQVVKDGEGATKFIEITVQGASSEAAATQVARSIANSPLVKTAIAGQDANWGRILCAAGYSGIQFDPDKVEIKLGDLIVCSNGAGLSFDENRAKEILSEEDIQITVNLQAGGHTSTMWTCDLTKEYVHINADYRT